MSWGCIESLCPEKSPLSKNQPPQSGRTSTDPTLPPSLLFPFLVASGYKSNLWSSEKVIWGKRRYIRQGFMFSSCKCVCKKGES